MTEQENGGLLLSGLDGANPLAFLAALGTLRGLTLAWPERSIRLSWTLLDTWRPCLHMDGDTPGENEALDGLDVFMQMRPGHGALEIADNLPIPIDDFQKHAIRAANAAFANPERRAEADFVASFGCDVLPDKQGRIQDTALRALGAGQTQFLKPMRELAEKTTRDHLRRCLLAPWTRQDKGKGVTMRWDPEDDRRYAYRFTDPATDSKAARDASEEQKTELGANRLGFEALPLFPVMPLGRSVSTTGFDGRVWTWPIWEPAADLNTVRSLLALRQLQEPVPNRQELFAMGIREVFRSRRINNGRYRNFTPSTPA